MTYQEYYDKIRDDFAMMQHELNNAEAKLANSGNGFVDKSEIDNFLKVKTAWQSSANTYYIFLDYIKTKDFDPSDEMV